MANAIIDKTEKYVLHTYNRAPFTLVRGEGMYVYDSDGKRYLDFASGISVNALGHADTELAAAVSEQIAQLSHVCNLFYSAPQAELAETLCQISALPTKCISLIRAPKRWKRPSNSPANMRVTPTVPAKQGS